METPLDHPILGAKSFVDGLMIDLSLRKIMDSMNTLDALEKEAIASGDKGALSDCISGRLFFEESIISLLEERRNIMPKVYRA